MVFYSQEQREFNEPNLRKKLSASSFFASDFRTFSNSTFTLFRQFEVFGLQENVGTGELEGIIRLCVSHSTIRKLTM